MRTATMTCHSSLIHSFIQHASMENVVWADPLLSSGELDVSHLVPTLKLKKSV